MDRLEVDRRRSPQQHHDLLSQAIHCVPGADEEARKAVERQEDDDEESIFEGKRKESGGYSEYQFTNLEKSNLGDAT